MKAAKFRVTGRVHGVGFRNYVASLADSLELHGEVWNTRDGAVEGVAEGERLDYLLALLEKGPGRVDSVKSWPIEPSGLEGFRIGQTR
jgi:acylphosphatase